jgi:hypothetical protein
MAKKERPSAAKADDEVVTLTARLKAVPFQSRSLFHRLATGALFITIRILKSDTEFNRSIPLSVYRLLFSAFFSVIHMRQG